MVPSGGDAKTFIKEITRLMNLWRDHSPLENIALKVIHIMPALLLQKPNKNSKAKDHVAALEKRLELWENGNTINYLMKESQFKKDCQLARDLKTSQKSMLSSNN